MSIEKVLLLEDELVTRKNLEEQLERMNYEVTSVATLQKAREHMAREAFDLVIADVGLPDGVGTALLEPVRSRNTHRPLVVIISGSGTFETAMECMRMGAFDYLIKPFTWQQVEVCLKKAEEHAQLVQVNSYLSHQAAQEDNSELIGQSRVMVELRELIRKVAPTDATVLIQGESGTGKEVVAHELFKGSQRSNRPYIRVNCAAIPEPLIESEFFGHEKGAFTGATNTRDGRFKIADSGTILLDEVSEVSGGIQAKLLRILQEREFERVGSNKPIHVDVRVLATTNRHLEECIQRKTFREDLYFRLNVVPIHLHPLRERMEDVPLLAKRFIERSAKRLGYTIPSIGGDCMEAMMTHRWPGNVRELDNVIQRAVIMAGGSDTLHAVHLGLAGMSNPTVHLNASIYMNGAEAEAEANGSGMEAGSNSQSYMASSGGAGVGNGNGNGNPNGAGMGMGVGAPAFRGLNTSERLPTLDEVEKDLIFAALRRCNNNRTHAAKMIGISLRTLRNKLSDYRQAGYREAMLTRDLDDAVSAVA